MKIICVLLILLITNAYSSTDSECLDTKSSGRRLNTDFDDEECKKYRTSNDTKYVCAASSDKKYCEEISRCFGYYIEFPEITNNELGKVCSKLPTSNESLYYCGYDEKGCTEVDECTFYYYDNYYNYYYSNQNSRRLATDLEEEDCEYFLTSDDLFYKCVPSTNKKFCEKREKTCKEMFIKPSTSYSNYVLTEEDCESLKTSNDNKYECVLSSEGNSCEEKSLSSSNTIKLSISILCLLFFF